MVSAAVTINMAAAATFIVFALCLLSHHPTTATLASLSSTDDDPCHIRTDDVPCLHVPNCQSGTATYSHFKITNTPTTQPATTPTRGTICWNEFGISVTEQATDQHVFTPWTQCNDPVFVNSSVLEIFVAPVQSPLDNPQWYFELDTAPSGTMWSGLSNNSRGNSSTCVSSNGCSQPGTLSCTGKSTFHHHLTTRAFNTTDGWGIELHIPFALFSNAYQPTSTMKPWSVWRMNFYRYSYPNGSNPDFSNYELSGWSPTHDPSFHVPARFGIVVLDEL